MRPPSLLFALLLLPSTALAFRPNDFKTCSQSGLCRRGRALSARASASGTSWESPYSIDRSTLALHPHEASFTAGVTSAIYPDVRFGIDVRVHEDGIVRVRIDEIGGLRKRYDEAASWVLIREPVISNDVKWEVGNNDLKARYGEVEVVVQYEPLRVTMLRGGVEQVVLNGRGLLHMEHFRTKEGSQPAQVEAGEGDAQTVMQVNPRAWFEGEEQDAWWEETWSSWTDSKPKGPESLSVDITFSNAPHVYGIPQHASPFSLPATTGPSAHYSDPYRLFNTDVFEYLADSPVSLYGSIPLMHAHGKHGTVGVFNAVGSETWIDIGHLNDSKGNGKGTETHWISESGILDIFLLPGPTPTHTLGQYLALTGAPPLPAHWALGYHQCRWNYVSSDDVRSVQKRFDEEDMPVDAFWLDIGYAEGHKYFMWDKKTFPDPVEMTKDVEAFERRMVVIIDPHLKRAKDYPVYKIASDLEVIVKPKSGEGEYEGWCWPGSSSWIDFFNPASWDMWVDMFKVESIDGKWSWTESTENIGIWNDMNEPTIFNGPDVSMPRDAIHYGGWEHRDVHNINGMLSTNQTYNALRQRSSPSKRPFVLSRSFYAGSHRFGAIWTGDNLGTWEHMAVGVKMVLANGIGGMGFVGADVGGYFGNPDPEMLVRWYAVGAFSPFFRSHAHIDTKRREPYLLDEPWKGMLRTILRVRYELLEVWYGAMREGSLGRGILRPQFMMFPDDEAGFAIDDQYYIGSSGLLFKPVTTKGAASVSIYLSDAEVYYNYFTHQIYVGGKRHLDVSARLDPSENVHEIPLLLRGGSIIATRTRPRRSSGLMKRDPLTLRVALDLNGAAKGEVYLDDGEGYGYMNGEVVWRGVEAESVRGKKGKGGELKIWSRDLALSDPSAGGLAVYEPGNVFAKSMEGVRVERIVVDGVGERPVGVSAGGVEVEWEWEEGVGYDDKRGGRAGVLVIRDPAVGIANDWTIVVRF
ncbi:glycoside hydrolase family 31 protein [Phlebopus sp. FC_14]|nr:glycoside hydrolase family 31 protein [Phlebopus sp. FC_14]